MKKRIIILTIAAVAAAAGFTACGSKEEPTTRQQTIYDIGVDQEEKAKDVVEMMNQNTNGIENEAATVEEQ